MTREESPAAPPASFVLSDALRARLSDFVEGRFGIKMPPSKKSLLEGRLSRRLRSLELDSFEAYWDYLSSDEGMEEELPFFSDLVSTHKTDFFRENSHFEALSGRILGELAGKLASGEALTAWSCGCSTGEEPHTLAMVLDDFRLSRGGQPGFQILGTDVSEPAIRRALRGVYLEDTTAAIPAPLRQRYLLRGSGPKEGLVRIVPELRAHIRYRVLNLMDESYGVPHRFHLIFFRNVMIYFEKDLQERIIRRLTGHLAPGGYLFLGHAESIFGFKHGLSAVEPTIYRKP